MSDNRGARQQLEKIFGKKCMIETLGIRYIPKEQRRNIKGYTKYDDKITFHHIHEKHNRWESNSRKWCFIKGI